MSADWSVYEEAACHILNSIRRELGIDLVEGKQSRPGKSGARWELDAVAWVEGKRGFLVVEMRRYITSRLKQEDLAAIAFRIEDVQAIGGIVVSPLPLQKGAELIAANKHIEHVRLDPESDASRYLAEYMGRRFIGDSITAEVQLGMHVDVQVLRGKQRQNPEQR